MTGIKRLFTLLVMGMIACAVWSQELLAYHVVGNVTYTSNGKTLPLVMNKKISMATVVNIPYNGKLELLDENGGKRIILKQPGKGTVKALCSSQNNSISKLTGKYISYVKKQLTKSGLASKQRYTDMATVTRRKDSIQSAKEEVGLFDSFSKEFDDFLGETQKEFDDFRDKCNQEYADFVRKSWKEFGAEPPVYMPKVPDVKPVIYNGDPADTILKDKKQFLEEKTIVQPLKDEDVAEQPKPLEEIEQQPVAPKDTAYSHMPFQFFNTDMQVRLDEEKRIYVGELKPDRIADMLEVLSTKEYDNLVYDCLKLRKEHKYCDWAYLLMLKSVADQFCGEGTNEAALMLGYLYYQSGYKMRFAMDSTKLYVLVASRHSIYDKYSYIIDGERYYPMDDVKGVIRICQAKYPKEKGLSLYIKEPQTFGNTEFVTREIKSERYPDIHFNVKIGNGIVKFYDTYPTSYVGDDFMTRWAMYAGTPLEEDIQKQIYPVLKDELKGLTPLQATSRLLNLVQTGLKYEYDEKVWGGDRAFFSEETLYYPYCDCEDRAILFTRLVRDLLGLDCVLIYYPGHLAAAVNFPGEETRGAYYNYGGKDYIVCDPTYINAGVGKQMTGLDTANAVLTPLLTSKE